MEWNDILKIAVSRGASDIHLRAGLRPILRIMGTLVPLKEHPAISAEDIQKIIPALPPDFPLPIVLVQHMPPVFTAALAADLDRKSSLTVKEAADGDIVAPGTTLIAPGGKHMVLRQDENDNIVARMNEGPKENNCRPAVDVLFRSVGQCYGTRGVLSLICTGMGGDGMKGVESLKRKGCYCLTQSEATCVVYGMPAVVDEAGLSDESLDVDKIANRLTEIARRGVKQS